MCNRCNQIVTEVNCECQESIPCNPPTTCDCPVKDLSSDCILVNGDFPCSNIESGLSLTEFTQALDGYICEAIEEVNAGITLANVGTGSEVYKGVSGIGVKQIRKINAVGDLVTVTQNTNDISVSIDEAELENTIEALFPNYQAANVGTGTGIFKDETLNTFNFKSLVSTDSSVVITPSTNSINLSVTPGIIPDGSETKVTAGTNVVVTGTGTIASPYVVSTPTLDGSETKLASGLTTNVTGSGTVLAPYVTEVKNLQKKITSNYTLQSTDNHYTIIVDATSSNINITIPTGLVSKISVNFTQIGTNVVTFVASGTVLRSALGLKIKGDNYWANIYQREDVANTYQLAGALIL